MVKTMKCSWKMPWQPLFLLIVLGLSSFIFFKLYRTAVNSDHNITLLSTNIRSTILSEIENTGRFLVPLNSSASNLAAILSSSINGTELLSFNLIQEKVAPSLFLALSTIPYVSHASFTGMDGLMLLYTKDGEIFMAFANSSSSSCYTQPVNPNTGKLYGEAVYCDKKFRNSDKKFRNCDKKFRNLTVEEAMDKQAGSAWLGSETDFVFLYNAAVDGKGVVTIGYPTKMVADLFSRLEFQNADLHLVTSDGSVLVQSKLKGAHIDVRNGTVSVQTGDVDEAVFHSCKSDGELTHFHVKIEGKQHIFYCSNLEIGGVESLYVLAIPSEVAHKSRTLAVFLLGVMLGVILLLLCVSIIVILRSFRLEVFLRAALIKQMEATHQAERKSTNKSLAFASASHDIRASLAAISGLIDLCRESTRPESELAAKLVHMKSCAVDLLAILNSVLDTSKIESGKMELEEEEFDVAQLLEDVVDMFYPLGMMKGVDVVLDPSDCSILEFNLVKGDRGKLKQILCNLLSNATKFTSEGYIAVRATVKRASTQETVIVSDNNSICISNCWSRMHDGNSTNTEVEEKPIYMDYTFDIDDTGKGIPKERRELVFEDFVQVKETALGQGTGLGLGIIRSLVHLMGGEIKIVDKDHCERGTCFRFNVVLTACHSASGEAMSDNGYPMSTHRRFGMRSESFPLSSDASHVILFLAGDERRRVTTRLLRRFGLRVSLVKTSEALVHFLEQRINLPCADSSSASSETSGEQPSTLLVVIDANAAPTPELRSVLAKTREGIHNRHCKIIWLENPMSRNEAKSIPPCDRIVSRPFHGSQLYNALQLLPEFGGDHSPVSSSSKNQMSEEIVEVIVEGSNDKPLSGKNVLVVEDDRTLRMLSTTILRKLGATLEVRENGKEAFDLVCLCLKDKEPGSLPFDYIFMDCKMPYLDGFDATRMIREVEKDYGVHTPIIALTAYSSSEEIERAFKAGMDSHLVKPLSIQNVVQLLSQKR